MEAGEIAATGGTSGVVYGVTDTPKADPQSRVNTFVHVNPRPGNRVTASCSASTARAS